MEESILSAGGTRSDIAEKLEKILKERFPGLKYVLKEFKMINNGVYKVRFLFWDKFEKSFNASNREKVYIVYRDDEGNIRVELEE